MILKNATVYDTAVLRRLLSAVHEYLAPREGRLGGWSGKVTFEIRYARKGHCTGHAWINGYDSVLRVPKPGNGGLSCRQFIWIAYHEMMHLYGYRHRQFHDIRDEEVPKVLSPFGHTLLMSAEVPRTVSHGGSMKVKISGTAYVALDLSGITVGEVKEVKRGKGVVITIEAEAGAAQQIVERLKTIDTKAFTATYNAKYAARVDAKRLEKMLSQGSDSQVAGSIAPAAGAEAPSAGFADFGKDGLEPVAPSA